MTDFNYKKYSLENLENWMHDAMSAGEATPHYKCATLRSGTSKITSHHFRDKINV